MGNNVGPITSTGANGKLETSATITGDVNVDSLSVDTSGLVGKPSGGDFDTAFVSATRIACTNMPTYHPTLINQDIVTLFQINALGAVVKTYSRDDLPMTVALNTITVAGATFAATDTFVIYTNIERYFDSINLEMVDGEAVDVGAGNAGLGTQRVSISTDDVNQSAIKTAVEKIDDLQGALKSVDTDELITRVTDSSGVEINPAKEDGNLATLLTAVLARMSTDRATHTSPNDFTAAFTSSSTITLTGVPTGLTSGEQIVYIMVLHADHSYDKFVNGDDCYFDYTAGVVTIYGQGTPFVTADEYRVGLALQDKAYDSSLDINKTVDQSPARDWYTGPVALISAAQELDTTFTDLGAEISMEGYNQLGVYLTIDIGTSTNVQLRVLHKHTSGGAEEYREIYLGSPVINVTSINLNDYEVALDDDQLFKINIPVSNTSPFIQLQVQDDADGTGQINACYIVKAWGN